jgi:hypothetical protein
VSARSAAKRSPAVANKEFSTPSANAGQAGTGSSTVNPLARTASANRDNSESTWQSTADSSSR